MKQKGEIMELPDEIFIVVTEFDGNEPVPLALETFLDERCSKKEAIKRSRDIGNLYGETKIGQLVFDLDETIDLSDVTKSEENLEPIWA